MVRLRTRVGLAALAVALVATGCKFTGWSDTYARIGSRVARNWLVTQQQADGGFEVAGAPGFETPDAILALAEDAQQQAGWNPTQARFAVAAVRRNGHSALDAVDDFADGALTGGQAAKLILLVAKPLGYDPTAFDPQGDVPRNLLKKLDNSLLPDGSYGAFNATLYGVMAERIMGKQIGAATVQLIRDGQQSSGGWGYTGDDTATADVDTTSLAIEALVATGANRQDPAVLAGLRYLATNHRASGAWQSFGADDPNSTASAILAITAVGENPATSCWRDLVAPQLHGSPYASPVDWMKRQIAADGHIASPNDAFPPVSTFATSQGIEALRRGWLPAFFLSPAGC